ncbi:tetratricopeptide repeat protein [Flavobacterium sp. '19STA2R22 D10 B1']|uniref:tetratricopeptide repeat protein n=1 Tax=Flavobacterium aerium TaxID=3037261 RepID=UPI00278C7ADC|nr:tetratricopeptide repeat protein [Flavobacterium sp. '19STA2R22 D10 B1']
MNLTDFTYLLHKPDAIHDKHTLSLEKIVEEFPFFQSARALYLKGLYNQDSFKYNQMLKTTAAHTTDRSILFDFITSDTFTTLQNDFHDDQEEMILDIKVIDQEEIAPEIVIPEPKANTLEESIKNTIKEATSSIEEKIVVEEPQKDTTTLVTEKLEIGKPLDFSREEKHSFQEWLQLANFNPIDRAEKDAPIEKKEVIEEIDEERQKKNELIDKFIETSPKIITSKTTPINVIVSERSNADNSYLMTETLAKVYLEQKKYQKAIQAYEILILKYPEKSTFFADRIEDIKTLQQNNN